MRSWTEAFRRGRLALLAAGVCSAHAAALHVLLARPGWNPRPARALPLQVRVIEAPRSAAIPATVVPALASQAPHPPESDLMQEALDYASAMSGQAGDPALEGDDPVYVPRAWLDVAPVALDPVLISFPDVAGLVDLAIDVALFIDERGVVRDVQVETAGVAFAFVDAVTTAFMQARFAPGEIAGVPVRSRIRVQVQFRN